MKAGLSATTQHGDLGDRDYRLGLGAGLAACFSISPRFALQPEVLYVMKGAKIPPLELRNSAGIPFTLPGQTYAVDYIEVPLLARVSIPVEGSVAPYFLGGPCPAFKITEELRGGVDEEGVRTLDAIATRDLGLAIGAGLELGHSRRWLIEARYTAGLVNALADPQGLSVRNGGFLLTAGLAWHR